MGRRKHERAVTHTKRSDDYTPYRFPCLPEALSPFPDCTAFALQLPPSSIYRTATVGSIQSPSYLRATNDSIPDVILRKACHRWACRALCTAGDAHHEKRRLQKGLLYVFPMCA